MSFIRFLVCLIICFLSFSDAAFSKNESKSAFTDEFVSDVLKKTRPLVRDLKISDTDFVGEETAEELSDPLLTLEQTRVILGRGVISGMAEWCDLDWQKESFEPFMRKSRESGLSEKTMAYIGMLHGYGMNISKKIYSEKTCEDSDIKKVNSYLDK